MNLLGGSAAEMQIGGEGGDASVEDVSDLQTSASPSRTVGDEEMAMPGCHLILEKGQKR